MTLPQYTIIGIFALTIVGLLIEQRRPALVFGLAMLACYGLSLVSTTEMLSSMVNQGVVTLVLLISCSYSLEKTSFLRRLSAYLINGSVGKSVIRTLVATAFSSAFLNNTVVVATLIGPIKRNKLIPPDKLLIPVSYMSIVGGTLTLVGTSTNLIVNSQVIDAGLPSLQFFDFTLIACSALVAVSLVIAIFWRFLPASQFEEEQQQKYSIEADVSDGSALVGKSVEQNGLRHLESLFLAEIIRRGRVISPVRPTDIIEAGDKLIFFGDISKVWMLKQFHGLHSFAEQNGLPTGKLTEVLLKPNSTLEGKTLKSAGFRARFDAAVVAIRREGENVSGKLGNLKLKVGDILVLSVGPDFSNRSNLSKNFFILNGVQPDDMLTDWREWMVLGGFFTAIFASALLGVGLLKALLFYLAVLVVTRSLAVAELKRRFPLEIWVIVSSALVMAAAFTKTGTAVLLSEYVAYYLADKNILFAFIGIYLLTLLATEIVTNNAAAALAFPLAYSISVGMEVSPMPFIMAVSFAASGSFILPYGYQTNLMVFNAGNYRLKDYLRLGIPTSMAYSTTVLWAIPYFFPF